jgi:hypothetical protein
MGRRQHKKPKDRKVRNMLKSAAAQAGLDRADHFAAGRSAREWRPAATVTKNRRALAAKRACRGPVTD